MCHSARRRASALAALLCLAGALASSGAAAEPPEVASNACQVLDGESVAIVEIDESRGSDTSQSTRPAELPIAGADVELRIESEPHRYFEIQDKRLRLLRPLDRDGVLRENATGGQLQLEQQPLAAIYMQVSCLDRKRGRKLVLPVLVKVADVNDHAPRFSSNAFELQLDELTPLDARLPLLAASGPNQGQPLQALDLDAGPNGQLDFRLAEWQPEVDSAAAASTSAMQQPAPNTQPPPAPPTRPPPSFRLDSEPIAHGPMDPLEAEADSDETLLAGFNATSAELGRRARRSPATPAAPSAGWTNLMEEPEVGSAAAGARPESALDVFGLETVAGRPMLRLKRPLDYESQRSYTFAIVATDRAPEVAARLSSRARVQVRVLDADDLGPAFVLDQAGCSTGSPSAGAPRQRRRRRQLAANEEHEFDFGDAQAGSGATLGPQSAPLATTVLAQEPTGATDSAECLSAWPRGAPDGQAEYYASVLVGELTGELVRVSPQPIRARDRDELNAPIRYSFLNGTPDNWAHYFELDPLSGRLKQLAPVERAQRFLIWVRAQERTEAARSTLARLTINAQDSERGPPLLEANWGAGVVAENAPIGSRVAVSAQAALEPLVATSGPQQDSTQPPERFLRIQARAAQLAELKFETTSDAFKVDRQGYVLVNRWPLDRDADPQAALFTFQVIARRLGAPQGAARALSAPLSLNVSLLDVNDNPPQLANSSLELARIDATLGPAELAGSERREIRQLQVLDPDTAEHSRVQYSLVHVSNGGRPRFEVEAGSGRVLALGAFAAGEQFSLTVQARDELGRTSSGILEALVAPGPNRGAPAFVALEAGAPPPGSAGYSVQVSEAAPPRSQLIQVRAIDPEGGLVSYSITDGNVNGDFRIDARSGAIELAHWLDREDVDQYRLLVQARDSGGLASSRHVHVRVLDSNDESPSFERARYSFSLNESAPLGALVGRVRALDRDAPGPNSALSYRLESCEQLEERQPEAALAMNSKGSNHLASEEGAWSPVPAPDYCRLFSIDAQSGDIRLRARLDFERARSHLILVGARDQADQPRQTSVPVLVEVLDAQDERPRFELSQLELSVREDAPQGALIGRVRALDPDSSPQVSYLLRQGDASLFQLHPASGELRLRAPLDFERAREHRLVVGVAEHEPEPAQEFATGHEWPPGSVCAVTVRVLDVNDQTPEFEQARALPVRVHDSAAPGTTVARLRARDLDASAPNNELRYELVGPPAGGRPLGSAAPTGNTGGATSAACLKAFLLDPASGELSVRQDLRREPRLSECELVIRARDLGREPGPLSSTTVLSVHVEHLAGEPGALGGGGGGGGGLEGNGLPGFLLDSSAAAMSVELLENAPPDTLVKTLPVVNKPERVRCELLQGDELAHFELLANERQDCELRTSRRLAGPQVAPLDYEQRQLYSLQVRVSDADQPAPPPPPPPAPQAAPAGSTSNRALPQQVLQLQVRLLDANDNEPAWRPPSQGLQLAGPGRFVAAVPREAPADFLVGQLRASDADSAQTPFGRVTYELEGADLELGAPSGASLPEPRFRIDGQDGSVRTWRPLDDVPASRLPLRLRVRARDNAGPTGSGPLSHETRAELAVNVIDDRHRLVLVLPEVPVRRVLAAKQALVAALQARTSGLLVGVERIESLKPMSSLAATGGAQQARNSTGHNSTTAATGSGPAPNRQQGTDVWLHLFEVSSLRLLSSEEPRVRTHFLEARLAGELAELVGRALDLGATSGGQPHSHLRLPWSLEAASAAAAAAAAANRTPAARLLGGQGATTTDSLASALILLAMLIALVSTVQVVAQCGTAAKPAGGLHEASVEMLKQQQQLYGGPLRSIQLPGGPEARLLHPLGLQPYQQLQANLAAGHKQQQQQQLLLDAQLAKEYETQMLKLSVLFDDSHSVELGAGQSLEPAAKLGPLA